MKDKIIALIEENRISTTEVADILGKTGAIPNISPLTNGLFYAGEVAFIYAVNNSNWEVHKQIQEYDLQDKIVYVHGINCDRAIFGDLVSKYILLYKKAKAIVVNGKLRDAHKLIKEKYPIWCTGVSPIGCFNTPSSNTMSPQARLELIEKYNSSIMVCDDSGVVLIPKEVINKELIEKLIFIENQEDIWYYCMDTLKMSTFQIVCEKQYMNNNSLLNEEQRERLIKYSEK